MYEFLQESSGFNISKSCRTLRQVFGPAFTAKTVVISFIRYFRNLFLKYEKTLIKARDKISMGIVLKLLNYIIKKMPTRKRIKMKIEWVRY